MLLVLLLAELGQRVFQEVVDKALQIQREL
jgi:hypothetical protein